MCVVKTNAKMVLHHKNKHNEYVHRKNECNEYVRPKNERNEYVHRKNEHNEYVRHKNERNRVGMMKTNIFDERRGIYARNLRQQ